MAGDQESADPGVAVNANAENATADAVTILPIVFIPFSNKVEPPWAPAVIELSPIRLPALVVSVVHLTIKSLLCCETLRSRQRDRSAAALLLLLQRPLLRKNCVCRKPGANEKM